MSPAFKTTLCSDFEVGVQKKNTSVMHAEGTADLRWACTSHDVPVAKPPALLDGPLFALHVELSPAQLLHCFSCTWLYQSAPARPVPFGTNMLFCLQRFGACQNGNGCSYAHGTSDRLPHIVTSATLCPIFQASCCVVCTPRAQPRLRYCCIDGCPFQQELVVQGSSLGSFDTPASLLAKHSMQLTQRQRFTRQLTQSTH